MNRIDLYSTRLFIVVQNALLRQNQGQSFVLIIYIFIGSNFNTQCIDPR